MKPTGHISRRFDHQLDSTKKLLLEMGGRIEEMAADALRALMERDTDLAIEVRGRDPEIDRLQKVVDEHCIKILALRQPTASDLRLITAALKIVTDLERIGDLVVNMCERVEELNAQPQVKPYSKLPRMVELAQGMVSDVLNAFVEGDAEAARGILERDEEVDDLNRRMFHEVMERTIEEPDLIRPAISLLFIAKYVERIADHATNVAEMVIYLVEGEDVRHTTHS